MSYVKDVIKAEMLSAGSGLLHKFPPLQYPWRKFNGIETEADVLLHWRRDRWHHLTDSGFLTLPGSGEGASSRGMSDWTLGIIAVDQRRYLDEVLTNPTRVPAIGYKAADDVTMVGVYEGSRRRGVEHFMNEIHDYPGMIGLAVGIGKHPNVIAIGSADMTGEDFLPSPTESIPVTPRLLSQHYRV